MKDWDLGPAALAPAALPAVLYAVGRVLVHRRGIGWAVGRDVAFAAGSACSVVATCSPLAAHDELFPVHVIQHLLLGMAAPLAFALAAPGHHAAARERGARACRRARRSARR